MMTQQTKKEIEICIYIYIFFKTYYYDFFELFANIFEWLPNEKKNDMYVHRSYKTDQTA